MDMDPHIEELFQNSNPFPAGDLSFDPDYERCASAAMLLEDMLAEYFGGEVARLMKEYTDARAEMEWFHCLHAFYQGYLAGQAPPLHSKTNNNLFTS